MTAVRIPTEEQYLGAVRFSGESAWTPSGVAIDPDGSTLRLGAPVPVAAVTTRGVAMIPSKHGIAAATFEVPANATVPRLLPQAPVLLEEIDVTSPPHTALIAAGSGKSAGRLEVTDVTFGAVERNTVLLDLGRRRRAEHVAVLQIGATEEPDHLLVELVNSSRGERGNLVGQYRLGDPDGGGQHALAELVIRLICQGSAKVRRNASS
ncbi:MAG: hypothetical protein AAFZ07_21420 [Actinomycetota bacterium]